MLYVTIEQNSEIATSLTRLLNALFCKNELLISSLILRYAQVRLCKNIDRMTLSIPKNLTKIKSDRVNGMRDIR